MYFFSDHMQNTTYWLRLICYRSYSARAKARGYLSRVVRARAKARGYPLLTFHHISNDFLFLCDCL